MEKLSRDFIKILIFVNFGLIFIVVLYIITWPEGQQAQIDKLADRESYDSDVLLNKIIENQREIGFRLEDLGIHIDILTATKDQEVKEMGWK